MGEARPEAVRVLLVAGDTAGWEALKGTRETLDAFGITWSQAADEQSSDLAGAHAVIVASADAALPGALAAATARPVVRVPTPDAARAGTSLLYEPATADLPAADVPFATVAIGEAGAKNAALFVVSVLALEDSRLWAEWLAFRQRQTDAVLASPPLSTR